LLLTRILSSPPYDIDIPVVDGIPFLTGIGVKEVVDKIEKLLTTQ